MKPRNTLNTRKIKSLEFSSVVSASQYSEGYKAGYELAMAQVLNMIDGKYGSVQNPAVILGRRGGSVKSARKAISSAENGKLGGRPRKTQI